MSIEVCDFSRQELDVYEHRLAFRNDSLGGLDLVAVGVVGLQFVSQPLSGGGVLNF
jgi:hypothetical protein